MRTLTTNIEFFKNQKSFFDYSSRYATMRSYSYNNNYFLYDVNNLVLNYLEDLERFNKINLILLKKEKKYFLDNDTQNNFQLLKQHTKEISETKNSIKNELKEASKILNIGFEKYNNNHSFKNDVFKHLQQINTLVSRYELLVHDNSLSVLISKSLQNSKEKSFLDYLLNKQEENNSILPIADEIKKKSFKLR